MCPLPAAVRGALGKMTVVALVLAKVMEAVSGAVPYSLAVALRGSCAGAGMMPRGTILLAQTIYLAASCRHAARGGETAAAGAVAGANTVTILIVIPMAAILVRGTAGRADRCRRNSAAGGHRHTFGPTTTECLRITGKPRQTHCGQQKQLQATHDIRPPRGKEA